MDPLGGKVALVTGAASGIGLALARAFAAEGMRLYLADIDTAGLDAAAAELRGAGTEVVTGVHDVSTGEAVETMAADAIDAYGAVHVLCNNAGIGAGGLIGGFDVDLWRRVIDIDLWSVLHGMRVFLPLMNAQGEGHIVNTASVAGLFTAPFMGPYTVAKFGVVAISETAFHEGAMLGSPVGISVLCPGWVRTSIADNVPGDADDEMAGMVRGALASFVESGMDPADVAAQVVDAVRTRRFYVLTHPESATMVQRRMTAIVEGGDPPTVSMENI